MLINCRVIPSIYVAGTHLYTWVERETVWSKVSCRRKKHDGSQAWHAFLKTPEDVFRVQKAKCAGYLPKQIQFSFVLKAKEIKC